MHSFSKKFSKPSKQDVRSEIHKALIEEEPLDDYDYDLDWLEERLDRLYDRDYAADHYYDASLDEADLD